MKQHILILLLIALLFEAVFLVFTPRSTEQMEEIAMTELEDFLGNGYDKIYNLNGPFVSEKAKEFIEYFWFKKLEWGDSAKIYVKVYKSPLSPNRFESWWRNYLLYLSSSITMNYQWNYLIIKTSNKGINSFEEVFPEGDNRINLMSSLSLNIDSTKYQGYEITISAKKLLYLLKKGYFEILEKNNSETIISFYEPIASFYSDKNDSDTVSVMTAKVFVNDSSSISIFPYNAPIEIWN